MDVAIFLALLATYIRKASFSDSIKNLYLLSQKDVGADGALLLKPFYLIPFLL